MRIDAKLLFVPIFFTATFALGACGQKDEGGNKVQLKDMEVVDGTTSDSMTDLDGVQAEGTTAATTANETDKTATRTTEKKDAPADSAVDSGDAEVVADQ